SIPLAPRRRAGESFDCNFHPVILRQLKLQIRRRHSWDGSLQTRDGFREDRFHPTAMDVGAGAEHVGKFVQSTPVVDELLRADDAVSRSNKFEIANRMQHVGSHPAAGLLSQNRWAE